MQARSAALTRAKQEKFDLVIIGGGITGAGIAQNAVTRGLSVLVIEKNDFASGTSSKTTKLIHGGLRYLEQFHIKLCRELCEERERLKKLAPHMVKDFSFVIPFKGNPLFGAKVALGLTVYDLLTLWAGTGNFHKRLSRKRVAELVPGLDSPAISGGLEFHDAISDDSRLVLAVLKSAADRGACLINYVQAQGFKVEDGKVTAIECRDRFGGEEFAVACGSCINATGVWTDEVLAKVTPNAEKKMSPSKGVHLLLPASRLETRTACFLPTPDGRFVFVVPWLRGLMIGTTDTAYDGDIEHPAATMDDVDYLLGIVNSYTQSQKLTRADVVGSFAGLRPLVKLDASADSGGSSGMSREHLIFESAGKLLNVAGGKLTSYRLMAHEVVDKLKQMHPQLPVKDAKTDTLMLGGFKSPEDYLAVTAEISSRGRKTGLDPATIEHLIANYGKEALLVVELVEKEKSLAERICPDFPPIIAEVLFCVRTEMAVSLEDMLLRRVRLGLLNYKQTLDAAPKVSRIMQELLDWDEHRTRAELSALEQDQPVTMSAGLPTA